MSDRLSVDDLAAVQRKLYDVNTEWYNLGLELGLRAPTLDSIKANYSGDSSQCFCQVLKEWLNRVNPPPTWQAMVNALKSPTVARYQVAEQIQTELQPCYVPPALSMQPLSPQPLSPQLLSPQSLPPQLLSLQPHSPQPPSTFAQPHPKSLGFTVPSATPVPAVPQTSTSQTSGLQLQSQARRQPASEQTGLKPGSVGGVKQISVGMADQVSKATEIPTVRSTAVKQPVIDEQQLDDHLQKKYTIDSVTPSATAIQSVPGSHVSNATTPVPAVPQSSTSQTSGLQLQIKANRQQASQQTGTKQVSVGGAKLSGADQVSKATRISTVTPTGHKRGSSESEVPKAKRPNTAADVVGSYTFEFVNQPPDDLLCQKCKYVAEEPQQMKCCGALYCKSCLARATSNAASHGLRCCVKCKSRSLDHFFDRKSNDQIRKLKVKCTNLNEGCDWTGELKNLGDHRSQCPKEEILCTLSEVGCETRLLRENLDDHIAQNQQQHFHCAVTSISRLRQELASTRGELRELQETFSRSIQTLPRIFKLSNYAQIKETGKTWYSTPFYSRKSNDCKVRLCVQPLQASEHVGVALEVLTGLQLSIPANSLTVEVLNQERDDDDDDDDGDAHYSFTPSVSFGSKTHEKIIPVSTYLCDDCLFIRVSEKECTKKPWLVDPPMPRRPDLVSEFECDKALRTSD